MKVLKIIWLFFTIGILSACTAEEITTPSGSSESDSKATTEIAISLDDLLPVNMNSRAAGINELLSQINDLNIRVTTKASDNSQEKYTYIYCTADGIMIDGKLVTSTKAYYIDEEMKYIHCNDIAAVQVKRVQVIANYGEDLYNKRDWDAIAEEGDGRLNNGYCMMYGETRSSISNTHSGQGSLNCRKFTVQLRRTRAMLTVQIKGSDELKPGVTITPKKISLHHIPTQCVLLSDNRPTESAITDGVGVVKDIHWGTVTQRTSVGVHAYNEIPDNFSPLYLFENLQGVNKNISSGRPPQVTKFPQGCSSVADAKKNKTHSYVEIEADYQYKENGTLKNSGTIVYRFFLGKNDIDDFNVERNTYYRLTLNLKGFGGASEDGKVVDGKLVVNEEDLSWRVDMDIRDWGFEKSEYDFDAHSELGTIDVMGEGWKIESAVNEKGKEVGDQSWVRFAAPGTGTAGWTEPTKVGYEIAQGGKIQYYIQPMIYGEDFTDKTDINTKRTITVTVKKGEETQKITFTQWVPIKLNVNEKIVYMERFEEEPLQEWGCNGDNLKTKIISSKLGYKVSYNFGTAIGGEYENGNTWYINDRKLNAPAHIYCYEKSDVPGGAAGAVANYYVLPDQATLEAMIEYTKNNSNLSSSNIEPLSINEDYWTSSVEANDPTSTYFWNGTTQRFEKTTDRNLKKRTRAVYTTSAEGIVDYY